MIVFMRLKLMKLIKYNLGCGTDIKEGFINADFDPNLKDIDVIVDVNVIPMKVFEDNQFEYVFLDSILEHSNSPIKLMEDVHRISKPNAKVCVIVPYYNAPVGYPHKSFNWSFFEDFFSKEKNLYYTNCHYDVMHDYEGICELCHTDIIDLVPHVNGGMYCLDCHG